MLAPWAYGCTRWWILPWFSAVLLACLGLWLGGLLQRRRGPAGSRILLGLAVYLALHGWLLIANAGYRYDRDLLQFFKIKNLLAPWLPEAIDAADAVPMMLRVTGLLGVMLVATDAARHASWRRHLFWIIAGSGTLLALYGLIQRFSPIPLLYWEQADLSHNLFATYYYHGNAGAFMNLVFPFAFAAAIRGFAVKQSPGLRAFGVAALFLNLAAAIAIASKAAQVITVVLLVSSVIAYRREIFRLAGAGVSRRNQWLTAAALAMLCLGVLVLSADSTRQRWAFLPRLLNSDNARLLAYRACLRILPDAGWWGIGPGNFAIDFPHYTYGLPDGIMGIWSYAHEDYLQTVIEWGWVGAAAWAAIFFGAFRRGTKLLRGMPAGTASLVENGMTYRSALLALLGVAMHATMDFPLQIASIQVYVMVLAGLLWHVPAVKHSVVQVGTHRSATGRTAAIFRDPKRQPPAFNDDHPAC